MPESVKVRAGFGYYRCECSCGWTSKFTYKSRQHSREFEHLALVAAWEHGNAHMDETRQGNDTG